MTEYWQFHPYSIIGFLAVGLFIALANHRFIRRLGESPPPAAFPFVSVLVPARNEETNIEACVDSLLAQDYPDFEILVLDDQSTDNTHPILDRMIGSAKGTLRILDGSPLPVGWLGKNWACHQLAQSAKSNFLLYTDADTWHQPNMLRDSVSMLLADEADLLTAFPREQVVTWGERLTVPILSFATFSFLPIFLSRWLKLPFLSITIGQFMLFRRSAFDAIGGYAEIKSNPVDDVSLGRRVIQHGFQWLFVDATEYVTCRMYAGFQEALDGFTKNLFEFFGNHTSLYLLVWVWMAFTFLEPPLILLLSIFKVSFDFFPPGLAWIAVFEAMALFLIAFQRFRLPYYMILLYPISIGLFVLIAFRSLVFNLMGLGSWKARRLPRPILRW